MKKLLPIFMIILGLYGQSIADSKQSRTLLYNPDESDVTITYAALSVEAKTDDPNDGSLSIKFNDGVKNISKKLSQLQKAFTYMLKNRSKLIDSDKYDEYMKNFEQKLTSLCDRAKSGLSSMDSKAEKLIVKLETKCRQRDEQIEVLELDIEYMTTEQKDFKIDLDSASITSSDYVSLKTDYYKNKWQLHILKAKSASLKLQNTTERLIVSTFYSAKALNELKKDYYEQKKEFNQGRDSPMEK